MRILSRILHLLQTRPVVFGVEETELRVARGRSAIYDRPRVCPFQHLAELLEPLFPIDVGQREKDVLILKLFHDARAFHSTRFDLVLHVVAGHDVVQRVHGDHGFDALDLLGR